MVFGEDYRPYVRKTREALSESSIDFLYHNGMTDAERSELRQLSGKGTVPQSFVNGVCVGGCNDGPELWQGVVKLLQNGKIQKALATTDDTRETEKILKE